MHAMNPARRFDLSTGARFGMLVVFLMIANLSIAMSYYLRVPAGMNLRPIVVPALSTMSALLFTLSVIFVVSLTMRTRTSRLVAALVIANSVLAVVQLSVFLSSWLT